MLLVVAWDDRAEIVSQIKCLGERNKPAVPPKIGRGERDLVLVQCLPLFPGAQLLQAAITERAEIPRVVLAAPPRKLG